MAIKKLGFKTLGYRHLTLVLQLLAGISLLTLSYFTTEDNWTNDLLEAAIFKTTPIDTKPFNRAKACIKS